MMPATVRIIEFIQVLPVGNAQIPHVAIYNTTHISDGDVKELIRTGTWIHPNPYVIFTTKEQHENTFGPIPETEE